MHIRHLLIKNFRAIEELSADLSPSVNVIVGPNGVGKTTILQAIRVSKALIAPRTQNETQQVLISLGAVSPHFPQRMSISALARDESKSVEIRCTYALAEDEIAILSAESPRDYSEYCVISTWPEFRQSCDALPVLCITARSSCAHFNQI